MGDRNACYVDLDSTLLFTDATFQISPPKHRGLQLNDPRKVANYLKASVDQLEYHRIYDKVCQLYDMSGSEMWMTDHVTEYEKMDKIISDSMLHVDRTLLRNTTSKFEWSIHLAQAFQAVRYGSSASRDNKV